MPLIEMFTPGRNLYPGGSSTFAMLAQAFRRMAENRDTIDGKLRADWATDDALTLGAAKSHAEQKVAGAFTTATEYTTSQVSAAEARAAAAATGYTDNQVAAVQAGQVPDTRIDEGIDRAVNDGRVNATASDPVIAGLVTTPGTATRGQMDARYLKVTEAPLDPRRYGAVLDGVTDDTAAFRAAFDALPASGGTLVVRGGIGVTQRIQVNNKARTTVEFDGAELRATTAAPDNGAANAGVLLGFAGCTDLTLRNVRLNGNRENIASVASGTTGHGQQVSMIISGCTRVEVLNPRVIGAVHDAIAGADSKQVTITSPTIENVGETGVYFSTGSQDIAIIGGSIKRTGQSGYWGNVLQFRKDCSRIAVAGLVADTSYGGLAFTEGITDVTVSGFNGSNMGMPFNINSAGTANPVNARIRFASSQFKASATPLAALPSLVNDLEVIGCGFFGGFKQLSFIDRLLGCTIDGFVPTNGQSAVLLKTGASVTDCRIRNITGRGIEVQGAGASVFNTRFENLSDLAIRILAAGTGFRHGGNTYTGVTGGPFFDSTTNSTIGAAQTAGASSAAPGAATHKIKLVDPITNIAYYVPAIPV